MDMLFILQWIGTVMIVAGALFILIGSFGIWRMPDFFSRLHPASISDSLGMPLILIGTLLQGHYGLLTVKIVLLVIFAMITSATASHALAKAALLSGLKPLGEIEQEKAVKAVVPKHKSAPKKIKLMKDAPRGKA